jgi:hypothetical protein
MPATKQFRGLRNVGLSERFRMGDLDGAQNIDLDDTGHAARRDGQTLIDSGAKRSIWSDGYVCLFVEGTSLKRLYSDNTSTIVRSGLIAGARMSFVSLGRRVYYSNGTDTGCYAISGDRSWGIVPPQTAPVTTVTGGSLPAGAYQYTMTYVRADGQESGAAVASVIEVSSGGIEFSLLPVSADPDVTHKNLYLSPANGDKFYLAKTILGEETETYYGGDGTGLQLPLTTQHLGPAPAGHLVAEYNGYALIATSGFIFYSEPDSTELFDLRSFLPFGSRVTNIGKLRSALVVTTEKDTFILAGSSPEAFDLDARTAVGGIEGSMTRINLRHLPESDSEEDVPVWMSGSGLCFAMPDGEIKNMTANRYRFPDYNGVGNGSIRKKDDGTVQYLFTASA